MSRICQSYMPMITRTLFHLAVLCTSLRCGASLWHIMKCIYLCIARSTAEVTHIVQASRVPQAPRYRITGEISISSSLRLPYTVSEVRLALYGKEQDPIQSEPIGYLNVTCPTVGGQILVPPALFDSQAAVIRCTFDLPEPTTGELTAAAQLMVEARTALSSIFDLDSKAVQTYDFMKMPIVDVARGGCAFTGAEYLTNGTGYDFVPYAPTRLQGSMPKMSTGMLGATVCSNVSYSWTAIYTANFTDNDCGDYMVSLLEIHSEKAWHNRRGKLTGHGTIEKGIRVQLCMCIVHCGEEEYPGFTVSPSLSGRPLNSLWHTLGYSCGK